LFSQTIFGVEFCDRMSRRIASFGEPKIPKAQVKYLAVIMTEYPFLCVLCLSIFAHNPVVLISLYFFALVAVGLLKKFGNASIK
jgi:hypothetical protein